VEGLCPAVMDDISSELSNLSPTVFVARRLLNEIKQEAGKGNSILCA